MAQCMMSACERQATTCQGMWHVMQVSAAVTNATGMERTIRTEADIKKWFERADFDHSGSLSKREFVVMYIGLLADKAKVN